MQRAAVGRTNLTHLEIVLCLNTHKCCPNRFGVICLTCFWFAEWDEQQRNCQCGNCQSIGRSTETERGITTAGWLIITVFKMYLRCPDLSKSRLGLDLFTLTFKTIGQNHIHRMWESSGYLSKLETVSEPCDLWGVAVPVHRPLGAPDIWQLLWKKPICSPVSLRGFCSCHMLVVTIWWWHRSQVGFSSSSINFSACYWVQRYGGDACWVSEGHWNLSAPSSCFISLMTSVHYLSALKVSHLNALIKEKDQLIDEKCDLLLKQKEELNQLSQG